MPPPAAPIRLCEVHLMPVPEGSRSPLPDRSALQSKRASLPFSESVLTAFLLSSADSELFEPPLRKPSQTQELFPNTKSLAALLWLLHGPESAPAFHCEHIPHPDDQIAADCPVGTPAFPSVQSYPCHCAAGSILPSVRPDRKDPEAFSDPHRISDSPPVPWPNTDLHTCGTH